MGVRLKASAGGSMEEMRIGGPAGGYEGFTHTWKGLDWLKVEDELEQVKHEHHPYNCSSTVVHRTLT